MTAEIEQNEAISLHKATRARYLNYALSVITSRALPDVRDGLKPVQRRILYGMYHGLRLTSDARYRKSAAVVGEVMAKYHPHGDQAIYDAMVRMAQDFSLRYPLVDGQGNFGSLDGDSAAAMRYTEARLEALSSELLLEIGKNTVAFRPNYDGQLSEPAVLPARLPNLLLNGATGIAVGMATNIPPHNLREVVKACVALIDSPELEVSDLMRWVKGPDFPTGGRILNTPAELQEIYETGHGTVQLCGEYEVEEHEEKAHQQQVVITSIPYTVNKATLVEKIADHISSSKLPQLKDIRDESTDEIRIVCDLAPRANPEVAMAYLYKHTPLKTNFHVNLTCLMPAATTQDEDEDETTEQALVPVRANLLDILRSFLDFRFEVVTRRLKHDLARLERRILILEAFAAIFNALDEALAIIRASANRAEAAEGLMVRFELIREQADAILDTRLYKLARLEINAILEELKAKRAEAEKIRALLDSEPARWQLIKAELKELNKTYGDKRRSKLGDAPTIESYSEEDYIISEDTFVIVTKEGWFKRQRSYKDASTIRVRDNDALKWILLTDTRESLIFFTSQGKAYTLRVDQIPATSGYGEAIQTRFDFSDGESIVGVSCTDSRCDVQFRGQPDRFRGRALKPLQEGEPPPPYLVALTRSGYTLRLPRTSFETPSNTNGRRLVRLASTGPDGEPDQVVLVQPCAGDEFLCAVTQGGRGVALPVSLLPLLKGAGRGVMLFKIQKQDTVIAAMVVTNKQDGPAVETPRGRRENISPSRYLAKSRKTVGRSILKRGTLKIIEAPSLLLEVLPHSAETDTDEDRGAHPSSTQDHQDLSDTQEEAVDSIQDPQGEPEDQTPPQLKLLF